MSPHGGQYLEAAPRGWDSRLKRTVDLNAALEEIEGYDHFHTWALRGRVHSLRLEFAEAARCFEESAARFEARTEWLPGDAALEFERLLDRFAHLLLQDAAEGLDPARQALKEEIGRRFFDDESSVSAGAGPRWMILASAESLIRGGTPESVYDGLGHVAMSCLFVPGGHTLGIETGIASAAAAWEFDDRVLADMCLRRARREYEELRSVLHRGILAARLHAVAVSWERDDDAKRWLSTIDGLDCPAASRDVFTRRAQILSDAVRTTGRVYLV